MGASGRAPAEAPYSAGDGKKQRQPSSEGGPAKKKARTTTIELQGVPSDGEALNEDTRITHGPANVFNPTEQFGHKRKSSEM